MAEGTEAHPGHLVELHLLPCGHPDQVNASGHLVRPSGQLPQHGTGLVMVGRLAQRTAPEPDESVGPEHHRLRVPRRDFECLGPGIGRDQHGQPQSMVVVFRALRGVDGKVDAGGPQQFAPPRRSRSQDEGRAAQ